MSKILIGENELAELIDRVAFLENALTEKPEKKGFFCTLVGKVPHDHPVPIGISDAEFVFGKRKNYDAWDAFLMLAKAYLRENPVFYMGETIRGMPVIRWNYPDKVKVIDKEPYEKKLLAAKMVAEMIDVFNKYFDEAHREVIYKPSKTEDAVIVKVI